MEGEVERVEALVVGQSGQLEGGAEPAALADADLFAEGQVEEVAVAHGVGLGAGDEVVEVFGQVRQGEPGGVVADAGGDQLTHDVSRVAAGVRLARARAG